MYSSSDIRGDATVGFKSEHRSPKAPCQTLSPKTDGHCKNKLSGLIAIASWKTPNSEIAEKVVLPVVLFFYENHPVLPVYFLSSIFVNKIL